MNMPSTITRALSALALFALAAPPSLRAQTEDPAHVHIGHVADGFRGTPEGLGLLPAAVAEAQVAAQHAGLAARDPTNLDGMKRHAGHVLHALDPSTVESGPGGGYGVKAGADGAARHIELAAASEGATENVKLHANHVATAASNVSGWTDEAIELARGIQSATTADEAAEKLHELIQLTDAIANGRDTDGDGRIGWQEGEGGLAQASQHLTLMRNAEGLAG
jgi:hypothetical protein